MTDPVALAPTPPEERERLLKLATTTSVLVACVLLVAKLVAWLFTGSVTLLASLIDSLMDAMASGINLFAVRYSLQPADAEHRFGYGKAESLAGLGQATFIAGSALFLLLEALDRLLVPEPMAAVGIGVGVMLFAIALTLGLLALQRHVIRRTGSTAIKADTLHYATDLMTNLGTILALVLAASGWLVADPLIALAIAGYILYSAAGIAREAIELLMDRELPGETRQRVLEIAFRPAEVRGVHDLRTRQSGGVYFLQLHLELDDDLPLVRAHAVAEGVEQSIAREFPNAEILIHEDPVSQVDRSQVRVELRPSGGEGANVPASPATGED
jgi:ferrous-iron efflux pump FieF